MGNMRVADDNHLIVNLLAARQSGEGEVIGFLPFGNLLVEESRAMGLERSVRTSQSAGTE